MTVSEVLENYNEENQNDISENSKKRWISEIDKKINPSAEENHRYKSLYARIVGYFVLWKNGGVPSDETDKIFEELVKAYHAENAYYFVSPVTRESILSNRGEGV